MSKTQLVSALAAASDLTNKQINTVLDSLAVIALESLKTSGEFTLPGLVKVTTKDKPATAERTGINPFTKASIIIAAKPASKVIKAKPVASFKKAL